MGDGIFIHFYNKVEVSHKPELVGNLQQSTPFGIPWLIRVTVFLVVCILGWTEQIKSSYFLLLEGGSLGWTNKCLIEVTWFVSTTVCSRTYTYSCYLQIHPWHEIVTVNTRWRLNFSRINFSFVLIVKKLIQCSWLCAWAVQRAN